MGIKNRTKKNSPAGQQAIFCCPIFSPCHAGHRRLQPVTQMSTASATAATGEMYRGIIDEQPRTVVAFKFKGPFPGFRDVDKPELDQSVTKKQKIRKLRLGTLQIGQRSHFSTRCWRTHHRCSGS
jgi:hypothetical protein